MRRTAVASQQLYHDGRDGHPVQHAHYRRRGLHQQVYEMKVYFYMGCNCKSRVCTANLSIIVEFILRVLYCSGNRDHEYVLDANALPKLHPSLRFKQRQLTKFSETREEKPENSVCMLGKKITDGFPNNELSFISCATMDILPTSYLINVYRNHPVHSAS